MNSVSMLLAIITLILVAGNFVVSGLVKLFSKDFPTAITLFVIGLLMLVLGIVYRQYLGSALLWYLIFSQLISILNEILHFITSSKITKFNKEQQENNTESEKKD